MPIVDKFNVDGQDYSIEPVLDAVPMQNSQHAVMSGGVFADKSDVPVQGSTKNFTAAGAYDFFDGSKASKSWLGKVFGHLLGRKWQRVVTANSYCAAYGKGVWVLGCATLGGLWSEDGTHWEQCTSLPANKPVYEVLYADDIFVAWVGDVGLYWSEDGKDWTLCTGTFNTTSKFLSYANGMWFCTGQSSGLYWSEDGKVWAQATGDISTSSIYRANGVIYANGIYVCGASTSTNFGAFWSEDGKAWTRATGGTGSVSWLTHLNGIWLAANGVGSSSNAGIIWSEDGKSWSAGTTSYSGADGYSVGNIVYGNGVFVAPALAAGSGSIGCLWSEDGKAWSQCTGITTYNITITAYGVAYADGIWVCGLNGYGVAWSNNGKDWTVGTAPETDLSGFRYANGIWLCKGAGRKAILYSLDGMVWNLSSANVDWEVNGVKNFIAYAAGVWLAISTAGCYCSSIEQLIEEGAITDENIPRVQG